MGGSPTRMPAIITPSLATGGAPIIRSTTILPVRTERFTPESAADPVQVAAQMTRLQKSVSDLTQSSRANPLSQPIIFENQACGTGGLKFRLVHNFGRPAKWVVVRWRGVSTSAAPALVEDVDDSPSETTVNMLVLRSTVAGTADIMVF